MGFHGKMQWQGEVPSFWHEYKCIFIPVPRTGTTSMSKIIPKPFHPHPDILEVKEVIPKKKFDAYFKFAFVRNPWDRIVSLYLRSRQQGFKRLSLYLRAQQQDFKSFVYSCKMASSHCAWPRSKKYQLDWLCDEDNNLLMDFVGRFENLQNDFNHVCKEIGLPQQKLGHKNNSGGHDYRDYYDSELIDVVHRNFKKDIEYFGYEFI
mgnify:CR=1 FL=1